MADHALLFAGRPNTSRVTASNYAFPTDKFSICFRYRATAPQNTGEGVFSQQNSVTITRQGTNDAQIYAYLNAPGDFAGLRRLMFRSLTFFGSDSTGDPTHNFNTKWHFRAYVVFVDTDTHAYVQEWEDKVLLQTLTVQYTGDTTSPNGTEPVNLGFSLYDGVAFNGIMDWIQIYNAKLTKDQLDSIYTNFVAPPDLTLGAEWRFNEGLGTTTADSSGNGNTGTLVGSPLPQWVDGPTAPFIVSESSTSQVLIANKIEGY